jgi:hypothetical protein
MQLAASGLNGFVIAILSLSKSSITNWAMPILQIHSTYTNNRGKYSSGILHGTGEVDAYTWNKKHNAEFLSVTILP